MIVISLPIMALGMDWLSMHTRIMPTKPATAPTDEYSRNLVRFTL